MNLWQKIAAARKSIGTIPRNGVNPRFSTPYALLSDIEGVIIPALNDAGLFLTAGGVEIAGRPALDVRIVDVESGEFASCPVPLEGLDDMQKVVAGFTYARRAGAVALLHLETGDPDDDGNTAAGQGQGRPASRPASPASNAQGSPPAPRPTPPRSAPQRGSGGQGGNKLRASWLVCPRCGEQSVRQAKSGKNAGLWLCMPWEEKGIDGCWARWTSAAAVAAEQDRTPEIEQDDPPAPTEDDLPF